VTLLKLGAGPIFCRLCRLAQHRGKSVDLLLGDPALDLVVIDPGLGQRGGLLAFARLERQLLKTLA
jgi:hypothetical protein